MAKNLLVWLGGQYSDDASLVGEKAAKLSELITIGFPVINGFVITTQVYREFLEENKLHTKLSHLKGSLTGEKLQQEIYKVCAKAPIPQQGIDEIFRAYIKLVGHIQHAPLTISSSYSQGPIVVKGEANLLIEVKKIFTEAAQKEINDGISLLVQLDILPETKGIIHSNVLDTALPLPQKEKEELVDLVKKAQKHFFFPQTYSWIFAKSALYIVDIKEFTPQQSSISHSPHTATKIYVDISDIGTISTIAQQHVDGVGLLRSDNIVREIGVHPKKMIDEGKSKEYIEKLVESITQVAKVFSPRPVVYQLSNLSTQQYRQLKGGIEYETLEQNPLFGYKGAYRFIHEPELLHLELDAIKHVRNKLGFKNLWLALPYVRTVHELQSLKSLVASNGLYRSPTFKIWLTVEIPSNVLLLDTFIEQGIDGVSIESDTLTTLLLGTDKDNHAVMHAVMHEFNEQDESVAWAIEHVIKTSHKHAVSVSLSGKAAFVYPLFLKHIVQLGITSVTVVPEALDTTRQHVAQFENERISK